MSTEAGQVHVACRSGKRSCALNSLTSHETRQLWLIGGIQTWTRLMMSTLMHRTYQFNFKDHALTTNNRLRNLQSPNTDATRRQ
jgi:hypothetical protein